MCCYCRLYRILFIIPPLAWQFHLVKMACFFYGHLLLCSFQMGSLSIGYFKNMLINSSFQSMHLFMVSHLTNCLSHEWHYCVRIIKRHTFFKEAKEGSMWNCLCSIWRDLFFRIFVMSVSLKEVNWNGVLLREHHP